MFFVDPQNLLYRMSEGTFANGPREITGDIVFASLLFFGAAAVTTAHQIHLHRWRQARRRVLLSAHR